jgi:hypothetical protein
MQPPEVGAQTTGSDRLHWNWQRQEELSWHVSISRRKNLQPSERKRLIEVITDQIRDVASEDHGVTSEGQLAKIAAKTRIKYMDLNGDAKPEVIAQAGAEETGCSPTGNCPFWILHRQGTSYEVLLEGEAQTFTIQRTRTKGYSDIVLSRHGSASESEAREYTFDGSFYREGPCFDVEWSDYGEDGKFDELKKPRVSPCGTSR